MPFQHIFANLTNLTGAGTIQTQTRNFCQLRVGQLNNILHRNGRITAFGVQFHGQQPETIALILGNNQVGIGNNMHIVGNGNQPLVYIADAIYLAKKLVVNTPHLVL